MKVKIRHGLTPALGEVSLYGGQIDTEKVKLMIIKFFLSLWSL